MYVCVCVCCMYLKELRWWNRTTGFLAPCDHVLWEECLVEEEEEEEADRQRILAAVTIITGKQFVTRKEMSCKSH